MTLGYLSFKTRGLRENEVECELVSRETVRLSAPCYTLRIAVIADTPVHRRSLLSCLKGKADALPVAFKQGHRYLLCRFRRFRIMADSPVGYLQCSECRSK